MIGDPLKPCGCIEEVLDGSGRVFRVGTCPRCLPAGSITWLIDNGCQLDMFRSSLEVDSMVSVSGLDLDADSTSEKEITARLIRETGLLF